MNKKGFTLPELLGVIILISLIGIISFSKITNRINNSKDDITEAQKKIILTATDLYIDNHKLYYEEKEGNIYCVLVQALIDEDYLSYPVLDASGEEINYNTKIKASYLNGNFNLEYDEESCSEVR